MKKGWLKNTTMEWILTVADKYGFEPETVEGIYGEMAQKYPTRAKSKTLEFIHLYSEGRNENGNSIESC